MPVNQYTPGINYPAGFQVANPFPLDAYSGPYPGGNTATALSAANSTILPVNRYLGMQVILLIWDSTAGKTYAYKYWYRGGTGDADLEQFASGSGSVVVGNNFTEGISAFGGTFNGFVNFYSGISATGATFNSLVNAYNTVRLNSDVFIGDAPSDNLTIVSAINASGTFAGITVSGTSRLNGDVVLGDATSDTITASGTFAGITVSGTSRLNGDVVLGDATSDTITASGTFAGITVGTRPAVFNAGATASRLDVTGVAKFVGGVTFDTLAVFGISASQGGVTFFSHNFPAGTSFGSSLSLVSLGNAALNANVLLGPSGGVLAGGTQGAVIVRSGTTFERSVNFSVGLTSGGIINSASGFSGPLLVPATTASTANNALNLAGLSGSSYARLDTASQQTFVGPIIIGNTLTVNGNFYVEGTLTTVNRTDLEIDDKIIVLGRTLDTNANFSLINNAGFWLGLSGAESPNPGQHTLYLLYQTGSDSWESGRDFNVRSGRGYKINGITALGFEYTSSDNGGVLYKAVNTGEIKGTVGFTNQVLVGAGANAAPVWTNVTALTGLTADRVTINTTGSGTHTLLTVASTSGAQLIYTDTGITFDMANHVLSCTRIEAIVDGGVWT